MTPSNAQLQKNLNEDDLNDVMKRALLGYQPLFLKNGIVLGTGMQFFHGDAKKSPKTMVNPRNCQIIRWVTSTYQLN